jgi:prevent-host-death family protein
MIDVLGGMIRGEALEWRRGVRGMRIAPLADVKARLSAYLDECGAEGPVVITRNGKAAAVLLVPNDDDDLERLLLGRSRRFRALLDRSRRSIKEGKGMSESGFWQAVRKRAQQRKAAAAKGRRNGKS